MVYLTRVAGYAFKSYNIAKAPRKYLRKGFIDSLSLKVRAGNGGTGLPKYGGVGGKGGNVVLVADEAYTSLNHVISQCRKKNLIAGHGYNSEIKGILGKPGEDYVIPVPRGVTVYEPSGALVGDLDEADSKLVVAKGGIGGCQETGYSGQKGQNLTIILDLKLIADVALVGFPNAGKSTLLKAVSNAKPKIASYPFTTVRPNLGIMNFPDLRQITVADLPGLIEGAHANIGMGHKFLKHVDRTKLIVFMVDIEGFQLKVTHKLRSCLETIILLNKELELYKPDLVNMHSMLIINKMDTPDAEKKFREIEPALNDLTIALDSFPEEMRPETPLRFDDILTTSLINNIPEEIELIKEKIRTNLDKQAEEELAKQQDEPIESQVFKKLKQEFRTHTPMLT